MALVARLRALYRNLFRRQQVEDRLDAEVRAYTDLVADERIAAGMSPAEARRTALAEAGGIEPVKQAVRDGRAGAMLDNFAQDIHYGLRQLRRSPGFATLAVITLAVGIGANTAIFTFVNAVLLRPLPYPNADRLTMLMSGLADQGRAPFSSFEVFEMQRRTRTFDQIAGIWVTNGALPGDGDAEQVKVADVTSNFLPLVCTRPALGRLFGPEDDLPNAPDTIILSHGVFMRRFGGNSSVIGKQVRFGRHTATVVGVLPEDFRLIFPNDASVPPTPEVYEAIPVGPWDPQGPSFLHLLARLRNGETLAHAQADMDSVAHQINGLGGRASMGNFTISAMALQADDVREVRRTLLLLFGGVALVLLIGCANIANLLMARARQRMRETTIRAALGASRSRLARQFLTESLLLGLLGSAAAVGLGWAATEAILAARPPSFANLAQVSLDWRAFGFTFMVAVAASILFGLAPVLAVRRIDLTRNLKDSSRQAGFRRRHWSSALVSAEVALAFVLLLATGLLTRTFINILGLHPGFSADNAFTFRVSTPGYAPLHLLQQKLGTIPGVESVSAISHLPLDDGGNWYDYYWKEGATAEEQTTRMADNRSILPGYFSTIGATLIEGRDFTDADDSAHEPVVVIDDVLARQLWPGVDAIGQKINISDSPKGFYQFERNWAVVVGVVHHVQYHSLTVIVRPQIYMPYPLAPRPSMSFVLHTSGDVPGLAAQVRAAVSSVSRDMPITHLEPMQTLVDRARAESRFASLLATLLSGLALVLASIGIYGVLSYSVAQRTMEIGIRMAIGAPRAQVMRMILADGFAWVLPGLAAGFLLSLIVAPLLTKFLFGITPGNAANYAVIFGVVVVVSVLAGYLPARRAMNLDPLTALRYE